MAASRCWSSSTRGVRCAGSNLSQNSQPPRSLQMYLHSQRRSPAPELRRSVAGLAFVLAVSGFPAACGGPQPSRTSDALWTENTAPRLERKFEPHGWDTLWTIGGTQGDSLLLNPFLLSASDSAVYLYDAGARRVLAFRATDGTLAWSFGRQGAGPDEFRGVRDLKADDHGVYVLDPRNNRIVRLGRDGSVGARVPLSQVGHAEQVAPLGNGEMVVLTMSAESAFAVIDEAGKVRGRFSLP